MRLANCSARKWQASVMLPTPACASAGFSAATSTRVQTLKKGCSKSR